MCVDTYVYGIESGHLLAFYNPDMNSPFSCSARGSPVELEGMPALVIETSISDSSGGNYSYQFICVQLDRWEEHR